MQRQFKKAVYEKYSLVVSFLDVFSRHQLKTSGVDEYGEMTFCKKQCVYTFSIVVRKLSCKKTYKKVAKSPPEPVKKDTWCMKRKKTDQILKSLINVQGKILFTVSLSYLPPHGFHNLAAARALFHLP